ncbi:hypothetical protein Tco_1280317 [Tanacetum coccineum]
MSDLKFADTYNLVAFLEKPTESEGSGILSKAKTVNGEVQLQALVDKKKVIITESTIRRDLQLKDANGVDCLPNDTILEQLTLMGMVKNVDSMVKFWMYPRFVQVFMNKQVGDMSHYKRIYVNPSHTKKIFGNIKWEGKDEAVNEENVPTHSNDPLLSSEDSLKLNELMELCTNLQKKVLDLETSKTTQALEIESLKRG